MYVSVYAYKLEMNDHFHSSDHNASDFLLHGSLAYGIVSPQKKNPKKKPEKTTLRSVPSPLVLGRLGSLSSNAMPICRMIALSIHFSPERQTFWVADYAMEWERVHEKLTFTILNFDFLVVRCFLYSLPCSSVWWSFLLLLPLFCLFLTFPPFFLPFVSFIVYWFAYFSILFSVYYTPISESPIGWLSGTNHYKYSICMKQIASLAQLQDLLFCLFRCFNRRHWTHFSLSETKLSSKMMKEEKNTAISPSWWSPHNQHLQLS